MFAFLVLVAIFSSALPFEAAAHHNIHKCDQNIVDKIYSYWRSNGGTPQHVTEHVSINIIIQPSDKSVTASKRKQLNLSPTV